MSKGTTIKDALSKWEEKNSEKASESPRVEMYGQYPPIEKMDASLSTLARCERLSLSTNGIEKIANLNGLKNLKILSLGRNNIKSLTGLEAVAESLTELWMSYNQLEKLKGISVLKKLKILYLSNNGVKEWTELNRLEAVGDTLIELWISYNFIEKLKGINVLKKLKVLYMSNNTVKDWNEFGKLVDLPCLEDLLFVGNPIEEKHSAEGDWRDLVATKLKRLKKLDGVPVIRQEQDEED